MGSLRGIQRGSQAAKTGAIRQNLDHRLQEEFEPGNWFTVWVTGKRQLLINIVRLLPLHLWNEQYGRVQDIADQEAGRTSLEITIQVDPDLQQWFKEHPDWWEVQNTGAKYTDEDRHLLLDYFVAKTSGPQKQVPTSTLYLLHLKDHPEAKPADFERMLRSVENKGLLSITDGLITLQPLGRRLFFEGY